MRWQRVTNFQSCIGKAYMVLQLRSIDDAHVQPRVDQEGGSDLTVSADGYKKVRIHLKRGRAISEIRLIRDERKKEFQKHRGKEQRPR